MTCYACGRQPGDVCRNENGCSAHDAPVHSLQPQPQVDHAAAEKPQPASVTPLNPAAAWPFPDRSRR